MEIISDKVFSKISGGEIIPGVPSPETICTNIKLLVNGSNELPGLDVSAAVQALLIGCPDDFVNEAAAISYVWDGGIPLPPIPPIP